MEPTDITKAGIWEDGDVVEMARFQVDGTNGVQSDISSISRKIFDLNSSTPETAIDTSTPAVANTVFDTLQTGSGWSDTSAGYNFRERIAGAEFPTGGHRYRVEYAFTGASAETFWIVFEHTAKAVSTS